MAIVTVRAPASLSNLGPGFDVLGVALDAAFDTVTASTADAPGITIDAPGDQDIPSDIRTNTAAVAAASVMRRLGLNSGLRLTIVKGVRPGSGLGSSASSAAGGAMAAAVALGQPAALHAIVQSALDGESVSSDARHGDNVVPATVGGIVIVDPNEPSRYRRIRPATEPHFAVVQPQLRILTSDARRRLPSTVSLAGAVHNAAALAFLVDAIRSGDWDEVGKSIMSDVIVEPARSVLVPVYGAVKSAALGAGALGCALTGSGPAMFAICDSRSKAERVADVMRQTCAGLSIAATAFVSGIDHEGTRVVRDVG